MVIHSLLAFTLNQANLHCIVVTILVTVYCRSDCVMFDASLVTRMTDWRNIEFDNKTFSLTTQTTCILKFFMKFFMYFLLYWLECML